MATPTIKIDQVTLGAGTAGQSRDDLVVGQVVTLTDPANPGGATWAWVLASRPPGSAAALTNANTATATFTPDIQGTYIILLTVDGFQSWVNWVDNNGVVIENVSTQGGCGVKFADGTRVPGAGENTQFGVTGWAPALYDFMSRTAARLPSANQKTDLGQLDAAPQGTIWYANSAGRVTRLAPGTSGHYLKTNGAGADPAWAAVSGGGSALVFQDEGTPVSGSPHTTVNFVGAGVTVTDGGGGVATVTIPGNTSETLQQTYNAGSAAIALTTAKPLQFTNVLDETINTLEITKQPTSSRAGNAIDVNLNAFATGAGLKVTHDGLATETNHGTGLWLNNSTAAANGAQQVSPDIRLTGRAWKSDATAASEQHDWVMRVFPTQGTSVSTSALSIRHRIDAAAFATVFQLNNVGQIVPTGLGTAALPIYTAGAVNQGMYAESTSQLGWATGGTQRMTLNSTSLFLNFSGSAGTPAIRMNDTNSGLTGGADTIGISTGGTLRATWSTTQLVSAVEIIPDATETRNLGGSTARWNTTYSRQFNASEDIIAGTTITAGSSGVGGFSGKYLTLAQAVETSGTPTKLITATGAAHTGLTASAEIIDIDLNLARTVQRATGAVTTQRAVYLRRPTYSFVGASVITRAATLAIQGPPVAGTNATITTALALDIEAGNMACAGAGTFGGAVQAIGPGDGSSPAFGVGTEGIDKVAASTISAVVGGFERARFNASGLVVLGSLFFNISETTTKIYRSAANEVAIDLSGTERFKLAATGAVFGRSVRTTPVALTDAVTVTPDLAESNQFTWTAAGSRTLANPSNIVAGMQWQIDFSQDGTGGRTITWGTSYKGPSGAAISGTQPFSGANQVTVFTFKAITTTNIVVIKSSGYY